MVYFVGSVQCLSNIQSNMVYSQLSQIYSLAAQRLAEFSNAFFQNVPQRRSDSNHGDNDRFQRNSRTNGKLFSVTIVGQDSSVPKIVFFVCRND